MAEDWLDRMRGFYLALDREMERAAPACIACGECCHFDRVDHLLYASGLERRYLKLVAPLPAQPDAAPALLTKGLRCPYQQGGRCAARAGRVLGCRLHFCGWLSESAAEDLAEVWHLRLKRLHDDLGEPWEYGPLLPLGDG